MNGSDEWAGGYIVSRPARRAPYMATALVPDVVWSASDCICPSLGAWTLAWASCDEAERRKQAARLGLAGTLEALVAWATSAFDHERLGWPNVFFEVDDAWEARERFFPEAGVYGVAIDPADAEALVAEAEAPPGLGAPGIALALKRRTRLASGVDDGIATSCELGHDVLAGDAGGGFHSYLCNGLETPLAERLGLRPGPLGLFAEAEDARRAASYCGLPSTGAEPGYWRAWRVVRYG